MKVFVIVKNGLGLMPTTERKARILLEDQKAKIVSFTPFSIRLLYKTGCATQPMDGGGDVGSKHVGLAASTETESVYKGEVTLRTDVKSNITTRRVLRHGRRYRKTRYRHPKFRYTTKRVYVEKPVKRKSTGRLTHWKKVSMKTESPRPEGWLPPSIQSRVDNEARWFRKLMAVMPPSAHLTLEVGRFDIARMKDPTIHGDLYQKGPQYDRENLKAFVFARDGYRCQACGAKGGSIRKDGSVVKLVAHHVYYRCLGGTDTAENEATVCDRCHTEENHRSGILHDWMEKGRRQKRYKDATFMNIIRKRLMAEFPEASFTYGNITAADRKTMGLRKSHADDALAVSACGREDVHLAVHAGCQYIVQARKKKRSLHEANPRKGRKEPNRTAKRNAKNTKTSGSFCLNDCIMVYGQIGWISGFSGSMAYVVDRDGDFIRTPGKTYNLVPLRDLGFIAHCGNWEYETVYA